MNKMSLISIQKLFSCLFSKYNCIEKENFWGRLSLYSACSWYECIFGCRTHSNFCIYRNTSMRNCSRWERKREWERMKWEKALQFMFAACDTFYMCVGPISVQCVELIHWMKEEKANAEIHTRSHILAHGESQVVGNRCASSCCRRYIWI